MPTGQLPPLQSSISSSSLPSSAALTDHASAAPSRSKSDHGDGNETAFTSAPGQLTSVASFGACTTIGTGGGNAGVNTRCGGRGAFTTTSDSGSGSDAGSASSGATMRPPRESKRKAAGSSVDPSPLGGPPHADGEGTAGGVVTGGILDAKKLHKLQPLLKAGMPYKAQPTLKVPKGEPSAGGKQQQQGSSSSSFGGAAAPARDAPVSHAHTSSFELQSSLVGAATLFESSSDHSNGPVGGREDGGMIEV